MNATAEFVDSRLDLEHMGLEEVSFVTAEVARDRLSLRAMLGGVRLAALGALSVLALVLARWALAGGAEESAAGATQRLSERSMESGPGFGVAVVVLGLVAAVTALATLRSHRLHD